MKSIWNQNWDEIELGSIAHIGTGCLYQQYEWPQDDLQPVVTIDRLQGSSIILSDTSYVRISEREHIRFKFKKGDVIFAHRASPAQLGKSVLFNLDQEVLHTKYLRIRPAAGYDSQFLLLVLEWCRMQDRFLRMANVKPNLAWILLDDLKKMKVPFPSEEEQLLMVTQSGLSLTQLGTSKPEPAIYS